jgi:hypothetical protein
MARLYGRQWSRGEILQRFPDISQIIKLQRATLREGRAEGVDVIDVATGSGFEFTVAPGRGLDITQARYKGIPLCWRAAPGEVNAAYFEPEGQGWMRGAVGGLLTTGGLTYMGSPSVDNGESLGIHGRASYLPATNVYADGAWDSNDYLMWVQGKVTESVALGMNVHLSRTISTELGASHFVIRDIVENRTWQPVEHMMLYHFNIGSPLLSETARLLVDSEEITPRDDDSLPGLEAWDTFLPPKTGRPHHLFYHQLRPDEDGLVHLMLVGMQNEATGPLAVYLTFAYETLPWLINWKCMTTGDYVTGIEPANAWVSGRAIERAAGRLRMLEPFETVEYEVIFGVLEGQEAIDTFAAEHNLGGAEHSSARLVRETAESTFPKG